MHLIIVKYLCVAYCCHRLLIHLGQLYKQMQFTSPLACCHFQKISDLWLLTVCRFLLQHLAIKILVLAGPWYPDLFKRNLNVLFLPGVCSISNPNESITRCSCSSIMLLCSGSFVEGFQPTCTYNITN